MSRSFLSLAALSCLLFAACAADDPDLTNVGDGLVDTTTTAITGQVKTVAGLPVADATVTVGERTTITDDQGVFTLTDLDPNAPELVARAPGFGTGHLKLALETDRVAQVTVHVLPTIAQTLPDGALGGRIDGPDGVRLGFPEGSFVAADGTTVTGAVDVEYTLMSTPDSILAAPGGMTARIEGGEEVMLESFGMVEVLLSSDGEPVEFQGEAEVDIPLSGSEEFEEGEIIGLWSFDEDAAVWVLEGEGSVEDGMFRARVPHFSFWNADQVSQTTCVKGRLKDPGGEPLDRVGIQHVGVDYNGSSSTQTGSQGEFCTVVRRASTAKLSTSGRLSDGMPFSWTHTTPTASNPASCGQIQLCTDLGDVTVSSAGADNDEDGYSIFEGDCDDEDSSRSPGAVEVCDGIDQNCNGAIDDVFVDADGDGFQLCDDCDDTQVNVYAGAPDVCDGIADNDCDGVTDLRESDQDGDGMSRCEGDCRDYDGSTQEACAFFDVAVAPEYVCGRMSDGLTWCWGTGDAQTTAVAEPFSAIDAGASFACGLNELGRAQCWGDDTYGQLAAPDAFLSELIVGGDFACGKQTNGELTCWGNDADGRTSPVLGVYRDISAGADKACAVLGSGVLRCWGAGTVDAQLYPSYSFDQVAAGDGHSCAVTDAGQAVCWGNNQHGQTTSPVAEFADIGVGTTHTCGLTTDGAVLCWGDNSRGQAVAPRGTFTSLSVAGDVGCGVRSGGIIECWGADGFGHLEVP